MLVSGCVNYFSDRARASEENVVKSKKKLMVIKDLKKKVGNDMKDGFRPTGMKIGYSVTQKLLQHLIFSLPSSLHYTFLEMVQWSTVLTLDFFTSLRYTSLALS